MATVRINMKVSASEPVAESIGGTFEVNASGCLDVYRIMRDRIREMAPPIADMDGETDTEH